MRSKQTSTMTKGSTTEQLLRSISEQNKVLVGVQDSTVADSALASSGGVGARRLRRGDVAAGVAAAVVDAAAAVAAVAAGMNVVGAVDAIAALPAVAEEQLALDGFVVEDDGTSGGEVRPVVDHGRADDSPSLPHIFLQLYNELSRKNGCA